MKLDTAEIIKELRRCASAAEAGASLEEKFGMSPLEADAVLNIRLSKLSSFGESFDPAEVRKAYEDSLAFKNEQRWKALIGTRYPRNPDKRESILLDRIED